MRRNPGRGLGLARDRERSVGIHAPGSDGSGEIHAKGLCRQGDPGWVNDACIDAKVGIRVEVEGGIGQINPIAD